MITATRLITGPASAPITLTEIKANSALASTDTNHDTLLRILRDAAVGQVQAYLRRALVYQTWKVWLDSWTDYLFPLVHPTADVIVLPLGQLRSVTHVKYTDTDSTQSTFSSDYYDVDTYSDPGLIRLGYGDSWPSDSLHPTNPIEIQYICGWYSGDVWVKSTVYTSGQVVIPATMADNLRGLAYECTTGGTAGATEPTWPTTLAGTVTDGTAVWTARERVPEEIRNALLLIVDDAFQNRGDIAMGPGLTALNLRRAESLLSPWRLWA